MGITRWVGRIHFDHSISFLKGFQAVLCLLGFVLGCFMYEVRADSAAFGHLIEINLLSPTVEDFAMLAVCAHSDECSPDRGRCARDLFGGEASVHGDGPGKAILHFAGAKENATCGKEQHF